MSVGVLRSIPHQSPEIDYGNREYKLKLIFRQDQRTAKMNKLATQLNYRLGEGDGKALYFLGVSDGGKSWGIPRDELDITIQFLIDTCQVLENDSCRKVSINNIRIYQGINPDYYVATVRISIEKIEESDSE